MPILTSGVPATTYVPFDVTYNVTPNGSGGSVKVAGTDFNGAPITPRTVFVATSVAVSGGSRLNMLALGGDATYTAPAYGQAPSVPGQPLLAIGDSFVDNGMISTSINRFQTAQSVTATAARLLGGKIFEMDAKGVAGETTTA